MRTRYDLLLSLELSFGIAFWLSERKLIPSEIDSNLFVSICRSNAICYEGDLMLVSY